MFGSGKAKVRPSIIFQGKEKYEGRSSYCYNQKQKVELARYDDQIEILWNENAYANSEPLIDWINQLLVPVLPCRPRLLALDVAKFYSISYTHEVLSTLCSNDILPSLILLGCTGLVQPLDVSVNKPFKCLLHDILNQLVDDFKAKNNLNLRKIPLTNMAAVSERRIWLYKQLKSLGTNLQEVIKSLLLKPLDN